MRTLFRKLTQIGGSFPIILVLVALCMASLFVILNATATNDALKDAPSSQFRYILVGFVIYLGLALTPYHRLVRLAPIFYVLGVCLLIAVFIPGMGKKVYGAYSWVKIGPHNSPLSFEPAEFAKLAYILGMAWFLRFREKQITHFSTVLMAVGLTAIPFLLVLKQPALGSASVFFPICTCMLFAAGTRVSYILIPLALIAGVTILSYYWIHVWDKPVPFLKPFQVARVKVFFDPSLDTKDRGWQANQSMIAIGSGGAVGKVPLPLLDLSVPDSLAVMKSGALTSKDWGQDTETALGYLPKNTSYNDLIFSVVGELLGFRGGAAFIICEGTVLLWCVWVAAFARDKVGALLAVGVMAMLFTHIFVNIGMTIQVVPITGIPLPFVSYGGTFVVACLAAMGLVQSVWVHRKNFDWA